MGQRDGSTVPRSAIRPSAAIADDIGQITRPMPFCPPSAAVPKRDVRLLIDPRIPNSLYWLLPETSGIIHTF
ncbi:hypothetical protein Pan258_05150 [Symmachiella dynata]|nr:hypothetical protein Pan258_05150 [Symmachiella dynata]